ncbi:multifunctional 2',3'-cyclic-nucleotide 2'-phosphodiesterase/5'-nucleotidase/3'-nucleotidase [Bacillus solimangrovi]|uniref:Multifunctional 2',3'-cyclic-nucleotide 2'-phosphodiesterase/5'-nucleotidase/3'-nucleotidase n=2 Tax=Bacillus solimangrovi TaxID=1305675 RepID=A0A1E5LFV4_9BACI|nr:multifunctional 2',3'-cyclic-nucleotide 2'-phosphodiesterase/5'-nucleotidase/3'-nucleotidase [Bacillus solimangrovi]
MAMSIGLPLDVNAEEVDKDVKKLTILHTNDVHGRADEGKYDGMGFAKLSTLVEQERSENENVLLLDAGDTVHGTTFATLVKGESIVDVMNVVGYDAMTAGNHDFNYGYERLLELEKMMEFPLLSANVVKEDDSLLLDPYIIEDVDGLKVGIFGLATPETSYKTHPKNVEGLTFTDPVEAAKDMVTELETQGADIIIALTHLGIDESSTETSIKVAEGAPGIDLIVDGHSHTTLVEGMQGENDTLIVSAGEYTKNLGVVDLTFEDGELVTKEASLISKEEASDVQPNAEVEAAINEVKTEQQEVLAEVVGSSEVVLDGEREQVRAGETNLGNLLTDAMLDLTGADVALSNGGGIRASIDAGEVTKGDIITAFPFGNYIITKEMTGSVIKEALEHGVSAYPEPNGGFPHVGGISFAIDTAQPAGDRVHSIKVAGQPIEMDKTYVVATNDFTGAGGDDYTMFADLPIKNEFAALDEALIGYMNKLGNVNPTVEDRIVEAAIKVEDTKENNGKKPEKDKDKDKGKDKEKPAKPEKQKLYVVKKGDTLSHIAIKHGTTWQQLQQLNEMSNPHLIFPGQKIEVPAK